MRWGNIGFEKRMLYLPDKSGYAARQGFEPRDPKPDCSRSNTPASNHTHDPIVLLPAF
jgi:hypothetical protein